MITLTEEQKQLALDLAAQGKSIKAIYSQLNISHSALWKYRQHDLKFEQDFACARQEGLEHNADELLDLVDEIPDVQKARLKSDNIKWILSKRKPATYGDRLDLNVNQTIDIGSALAEARNRVGIRDAHALASQGDTSLDEHILLDVSPVKVIEPNDPTDSELEDLLK